jgi:hypothetical protein
MRPSGTNFRIFQEIKRAAAKKNTATSSFKPT